MKFKNIGLLIIFIGIINLFVNIYITSKYESYAFNTLNSVLSSAIADHPELEDEIISNLLTKKPQILEKYGLNENNLTEITSFKTFKNNIILISLISYSLISLTFIIIYLIYNIKIKREINTINGYLQEILKGTYELNIADYNEDELSILKNDIYKVTIKLKELSQYEHTEKVHLMNTLEDISHQLKTPLTAIMVTNDILKSPELTNEERTKFLNKETKELEKMEWLITTLLKYSKLDSGMIILKKESILVSKLIKDIIDSLSISLELKKVDIKCSNLDFKLICDINWTKEALINILKNAIEHIDTKGHITITGENNPLYKSISIKDDGCGISKTDIKNIFKRFYSSNNSKNSVGIGLNMSKLIIEKQKGKIEVSSTKGLYTEFKIIFPKKNY